MSFYICIFNAKKYKSEAIWILIFMYTYRQFRFVSKLNIFTVVPLEIKRYSLYLKIHIPSNWGVSIEHPNWELWVIQSIQWNILFDNLSIDLIKNWGFIQNSNESLAMLFKAKKSHQLYQYLIWPRNCTSQLPRTTQTCI